MSEEMGGTIVDLIIGIAVFLIISGFIYSLFLFFTAEKQTIPQQDLKRIKGDVEKLLIEKNDFVEIPLSAAKYKIWLFQPKANLKDCRDLACVCAVEDDKITCKTLKNIKSSCTSKNFCITELKQEYEVKGGKKDFLRICSANYDLKIGDVCVES